MMKILKTILILALVVMSALWAWGKFGSLLSERAGGLTADASLSEWNNASGVERDMVVRAILAEPARISRLADCVTIMATISESQTMTIRDAVPLCISGTSAMNAIRNRV